MPKPFEMALSVQSLVKSSPAAFIMAVNDCSQRYGLQLTEHDAGIILASRNQSLQRMGRVELGNEPLIQLITAFSASPYINQSEYVDVICELTDIFYCLKNETMDEIPDDELIAIMKEYFDEGCQGSLELLAGRELEALAREVRFGYRGLERVEISGGME